MYKRELQQLLRQHFEKLLRAHKPAVPLALQKVCLLVLAYDAAPLSYGEALDFAEEQIQQAPRVGEGSSDASSLLPKSSATPAESGGGGTPALWSRALARRSSTASSEDKQQREALLGGRLESEEVPFLRALSPSLPHAAAAAHAAGLGFEVSVDAKTPSLVRAFWGVSANAVAAMVRLGRLSAECKAV